MTTRPIPADDELVALIQACLHNAGDLLADARHLLEASRVPRAHAMATLAFEEIGKACMCMLALLPQPTPFFGVRGQDNFWKAWNNHTDKLSWASGFLELLIRQPTTPVLAAAERLLADAHMNHLRKLRGFYVDYVDGSVLLPAEITDDEARELVSDVQGVLDVAKQGWCHDAVLERIREARAAGLANLLGTLSQAADVDPDSMIAVVSQLIHDGVAETRPTGQSAATSAEEA
jgi:AbiV family abortive infection protein